jgi:hypothetical protein
MTFGVYYSQLYQPLQRDSLYIPILTDFTKKKKPYKFKKKNTRHTHP